MKFQTILLTVFGVMAVVALVVFSQSDPKSDGDSVVAEASGNVVIWGTFPENEASRNMIQAFNKAYENGFSISYEFHEPEEFDDDIVEALASGKGPDVLLLPDNLVMRHSDKIDVIPYAQFPAAEFSSKFIQAAEIYMRPDGLVALPFAVDPMVMYWNRDVFNNSSVALPPVHWDEFLTLVPQLTKIDQRTKEIKQSALAFGEYANVDHAKDIIAMLFLQVGNPIVKMDKGYPVAKFAVDSDLQKFVPDQNIVSAFRFYMDFSNPEKSNYTWSRARSNSSNEFINGNLAIHFDFASSYDSIKLKNPHLNFAVAATPQPKDTSAQVTYGKVYGLSVLKSSMNKKTAFIAVTRLLLDADPAKKFAEAYHLPPVRRDHLVNRPTDDAAYIFYDAAIRARTWLDPKPETTSNIFATMVDDVSSGRLDTISALAKAQKDMSVALAPYKP